MATIKVIGNYEIDIDNNNNHEAREFVKMAIDSKTGLERPVYRNVGHYNTVPNALDGIYKDLCVKKANEKDSVTIKEWIDVINKTYNEIKEVFDLTEKKYNV